MMLQFELVLPCYNESKSLEALVNRAAQAAQAAGHTPETFQLVLVENGSKDNSLEVMNELKQGPLSTWFRVVRVTENRGYGFGIMSGLKTTTAKFVGWSHADQQCDPNDAFRALSIAQSSDKNILVKGTRNGRNWKDKLVTHVFEFMSRILLGLSHNEINAQPKVFKRALLIEFRNPPNTFAFDLYGLYVAQKNGFEFTTINVEFPPRIHGFSNWANTFFGRYKTILGMIKYMNELRSREGRL